MKYFVGIDLGATNAKAGIVDTSGRLISKEAKPIKGRSPREVVGALVQCVQKALEKGGVGWEEVIAIGIGSPGAIEGDVVKATANFPDWQDVPLPQLIKEELGMEIEIFLANDGDAAVAAEAWVGVGKLTVKNLIMISLGSGVGVGVLVDGRILRGASGTIEAGHTIIHPMGEFCGCSQRGCLELYASAKNVAKRAEDAANQPGMQCSLTGKRGISGYDVFVAAQSGDEVALRVIDEAADALGLACVNFTRLLDPKLIVFTGGMSLAGDYFLDKVKKAFAKYTWTKFKNHVELKLSEVKDDAGVIGAAAVCKLYLPAETANGRLETC